MSRFSTSGKGFRLTFENGLTISVQWGYGNYCSNNSHKWDEQEVLVKKGFFDSITAEIAVWDADDTWLRFGNDHDQVKGWVTADQVADYITKVKNATSIDELHEGE